MIQSLFSFLIAHQLHMAPSNVSFEDKLHADTELISVAELPQKHLEILPPPPVSAQAVYILDLESHSILHESGSETKRPIASLTKLMTAYIALKENDPQSIVKVSENAAQQEGSSMNLYSGEAITLKNLIFGALIESGNDAATSIAEFNSGNTTAFVDKMNQTAYQLGLENTVYKNPTGLDAEGAYSTARDLALLSKVLLENAAFREIVNIDQIKVYSEDGDQHLLINTNILLGENGIKGIKTGTTSTAGECLVSLTEVNGRDVLIVVLGSEQRFQDTRALLEWTKNSYQF